MREVRGQGRWRKRGRWGRKEESEKGKKKGGLQRGSLQGQKKG